MKKMLSAVAICAGFAAMLPAQSTQTMRANIRGGSTGDVGKCTIEVEVDGVADVEVRGDTGYLRTLQGQPSTWRRFECTSAMPRNPVDFRFKGIDGRGDVRLMREPGSAGAAVVRIDDNKGGREGYTFDLEWRGGAYAGNDPYYRNDTYNRNDPYRNDTYNRNRSADPYNRNDPYYDNQRSRSRDEYQDNAAAVGLCREAVRVRARGDYGVRNPAFVGANVDDMRGARDRVIGSFEGNRGERYDYSCTVNTNNGRINAVDIRRR